MGIDPKKIALGEDSAGGLMTAAVSQMARDKNGPKVIGHMLIYPATDARMETVSMKVFTDTPVWNSTLTKEVWNLLS